MINQLFDPAPLSAGASNSHVQLSSIEVAPYWLSAIVDSADDAIISKTLDGIIMSWNKGAERTFGYTAEEAIGQPVTMLMPPEHQNEEPSILARLRQGQKINHFETVRTHKDGRLLDISLSVSPIRNAEGTIIGASKIARDITDRKIAEERSNILQTIREPLVILDADLRVKLANRAFYQTFQVTEDETENKLFYELGNGEWKIPALCTLLEEIVPRDTQFNNFEVEHDFPHVGRKAMLLNARRVYQEPGGTQTILLSIEDVTERKRLENALQAHTRKLEWSNRELQDFAYIASHDLQEPLRAIQAFGDRLMSRHGQALGDEGRDYLNRMQNAAGRMRTLIQNLLEYSRVTTKANPFKIINLEQVANATVSDLSQRVEESGGRIEIGALPTIEADASQMRQLLQNLIGNALKFRRADVAPVIRLHTVEGWPCPDANKGSAGEEQCRFVVEDNGIGFDEKYAERIFSPFERLHSQRQYEGTGIGLAICRKIVERHGGYITARAVPGQGAGFTITLPVRQQQEEFKT
ncbi:MAG TPA: PAS domain S-box protein [Abditibacteriaceae bacterium]|jgi:PAS domain S-box-containing protein